MSAYLTKLPVTRKFKKKIEGNAQADKGVPAIAGYRAGQLSQTNLVHILVHT
jgi:hypothetical protein